MAVTNNPNIPNSDTYITLVSCEGEAPSKVFVDLDGIVQVVSFETEVRALDAEVSLSSIEGEIYQGSTLYGDLKYIGNIIADSDLVTKSIIDGDATFQNVLMVGTINRPSYVNGDMAIGRFVSIGGTNLQVTTLDGDAYIQVLDSNFGMEADGYVIITVNTKTIVLNLRTKAHSVYDESTLDAYATTGEMLFGSYKNKNISDAFVLGRSTDELALTAWNDEATSRTYSISYGSSGQGNLRNKKQPMAKGLKGTNWQLKIANSNQAFAEIRGIDLYVHELQRHV